MAKKDISFDNWMDTSKIRKEIAKQTPTPSHAKIENLRSGMKKIKCDCASIGNFRAVEGSRTEALRNIRV